LPALDRRRGARARGRAFRLIGPVQPSTIPTPRYLPRGRLAGAGALALMLAWLPAPQASAQPGGVRFPAKPIRLVIPFSPGGANELMARGIAQKVAASTGQPFLIEHHGGAGGTIGSAMVARAAPDGHTLLMGAASCISLAPALYAKLPYDPVRDFAPVTNVAAGPYVLVVHPSVPARNLPEFLALARARPGALNYASSGPGSISHFAAEMLRSAARVDLVNVSYKGTGPALADVLGGHVELMFADLGVVMPHLATGRLRAVAITGMRRSPLAPQLATVAESGLPGYGIVNWRGVLAPAAVPREIVVRLNAEIVKAVRAPDLSEALVREGYDPIADSPDAFAETIRTEVARFAKVVRAAGLSPI